MNVLISEKRKKYWHNQKWCECYLVSLWNASIYHNLPVPQRYGVEYVRDCVDACALSGAAIHEKCHGIIKKLNLKEIKGELTWKWVSNNLPCEFSIFCHRGFHSVLAVEIDKKRKRIAVTNLNKNRITWLQWSKLKSMMPIKNRYHNKPIKWTKL